MPGRAGHLCSPEWCSTSNSTCPNWIWSFPRNPTPPSVYQLPEHTEQNPGTHPTSSLPLAQATIIFHFQTIAILISPSPCSVLQQCDLSKTESGSCPLVYLKPLCGSLLQDKDLYNYLNITKRPSWLGPCYPLQPQLSPYCTLRVLDSHHTKHSAVPPNHYALPCLRAFAHALVCLTHTASSLCCLNFLVTSFQPKSNTIEKVFQTPCTLPSLCISLTATQITLYWIPLFPSYFYHVKSPHDDKLLEGRKHILVSGS